MDKQFILKCKCGWTEKTTGKSTDLLHLKEVLNSCSTCGKPREFKCLKCGINVKMYRIGARRG